MGKIIVDSSVMVAQIMQAMQEAVEVKSPTSPRSFCQFIKPAAAVYVDIGELVFVAGFSGRRFLVDVRQPHLRSKGGDFLLIFTGASNG